ncbi:ATP-grasp domain-containing protein [Robbsia andropogonis]|uniref:ATP-grasp domain-containing protein n=1 Tax=Robbsia andropogonis TaxID=28092 RepID=UPI0004B5F80D|nr:ATP-grasp domain-containing protein [Robbsia andropogonis]
MKHLVFVDGNGQIFNAIREALSLGHCVSFIQSSEFKYYDEETFAKDDQSRLFARIVLPRTTDSELVYDALHTLANAKAIDAVLCLLDLPIVAVARACHLLGIRFSNADALTLARDKMATRDALDRAFVPSAKAFRVHSLEEAIRACDAVGYPAILKPVSGLASIAAACVSDVSELRAAWDDAVARISAFPADIQASLGSGLLVEERLVGRMFSVEMAQRGAERHVFMMSGRDRSEVNETDHLGITMPAILSEEECAAATLYASDVIDALGFEFGFFHIELMWTNKGPRLIEVNPRPMGGSMPIQYQQLTGNSIFRSLFSLHLGESLEYASYWGHGAITSWRVRLAEQTKDAVSIDWSAVTESHSDIVKLSVFPQSQSVPSLSANTVLARFQVRGKTPEASTYAANQLLSHIEKVASIKLIYPAETAIVPPEVVIPKVFEQGVL